MSNTYACFVTLVFLLFPNLITALHGGGQEDEGGGGGGLFPVVGKHGTVVTKDQRWSVLTAEDGEISAVKVSDGKNGFYHLQFITMEPNSLFLPVHLHSDMVFYVDSGNGTLSWVDLEKDGDKLKQVDLKAGDVYRLRTGSFFYLESNLESDRRKFRVNAIFSDSKEQMLEGSSFGAYSSVRDLLLGFDDIVLQAALNVGEGVIQELKSGGKQPMIVHGVSKAENLYEVHYKIMRAFLGNLQNDLIDVSKNKHKDKNNKAYNIQEAKHDVDNCNGWSLVVTRKQLKALKDSDFGVFFVNLTTGSMMGPHWNPVTAEIAVVLRGRGMVHVVCPSTLDETECNNSRFRVEEGDVFMVPRYHPMAQISFNNESFIFMGFTTTQKNNHPQYLVGTASVFQALDKRVLATSLGVSNTTMDEILSAQREAIILECTSCAEEEERLMEEEIQRQEEEKRREEEEAREREEEEEEARRQREEEEAAAAAAAAAAASAKQREEEAAKQREQEEAAARQREEEAARQREQEEKAAREREQEEAAARQREQEEAAAAAAKQREEEAARQREQEAAVKKREEEAARERQQEEAEAAAAEEAARQRQQEEEAARQHKEEEARQREQQEEADRQREQQEEAARQREQEEQEAARQRQQQEEAARQREQEEEAARQQQEAEEARRRQQEGEAAGRQQHEKEETRGGGGGEGEAASMEEGAMARRQREAEEAARRRAGGGQGGGIHEEY